MSTPVRKFLVVFGFISSILGGLAILISLFVTGHWLVGLCLGIPSLAAFVAAMEVEEKYKVVDKWIKEE